MAMTFRVAEHFGPVCMDPDNGAALYALVTSALQGGESVILDFSGVTALTTSFLNPAIGRLSGTFSEKYLEERLSSEGLDEIDMSLVRAIRENAARFYSASPELQERLLEVTDHALDRF